METQTSDLSFGTKLEWWEEAAIENRRQVSRLHRIEKGLPKAYRPIFQRVMGEASLSTITADIEAGSTGMLQNYFPPQ